MAKNSKYPKMTPEEHARRDDTTRMVEERIAYHDAKAREEDPSWGPYAPWATLDDDGRFEQATQMVAERIAYHDAKALEEEQASAADDARHQSGG
jgi:hypothetical protein